MPYLSYYVVYSLNLVGKNHLLFPKKLLLGYIYFYVSKVIFKKVNFFYFKLIFF